MSSKIKNQRTMFFGSWPALLLALIGTGCGERFELGVAAQGIDQEETGQINLPVLVDGVEDADAVLAVRSWAQPLGDVDGDGMDDWMSSGSRLRYGRPRSADGVLVSPAEEGLSFAMDGSDDLFGERIDRAGDVNGDGYNDVVFGTIVGRLAYPYEPENAAEAAEDAENRTTDARLWAEQRAFLWYGGPDRTAGARELDDVAVAFPTSEGLPGLFQAELTERQRPEDEGYGATQNVFLTALGDIDGDGYDDLGWTIIFSWNAWNAERQGDDVNTTRTEGVTYIVYGRGEPLASDPAPAARLEGGASLRAIGDVNGDGYADVHAITLGGSLVIPGRAQRLAGELSIGEVGVPIVDDPLIFPAENIGDIDQDGYDDLIVLWEIDSEGVRYYLVYGSPTLLAAPIEKSAASATLAIPGRVATFTNVGDWNGDGAADILMLLGRVVTDASSELAGHEVGLVPGRSERYTGTHEISPYRPNAIIGNDNVAFARIVGDIDGDGLADLFFMPIVDNRSGPVYVKYGSPLPAISPIY